MSVEALSWALDQQVGDSTRKCILLILADVADRAGECWYGQKKLAERAECSPRTMRRHLAELEKQGLLTKTERHRQDGSRTTNLYRLGMTSETPGQSVQGGGQNDRTDYPPGQSDRGTGHERPGDRSPVSGGTEPSVNRTEDTSTSSSLRSSDGASPGVEKSGSVEKSDDAGEDDELSWGEFAGWMRTTGCPEYLWGQEEPPSGPAGPDDEWSLERDLSICRELQKEGEDLEIIQEVVKRVPDLVPLDPPLRMTLFWQEGRRDRWNQLKAVVLRELEEDARRSQHGPQKLQVEIEAA